MNVGKHVMTLLRVDRDALVNLDKQVCKKNSDFSNQLAAIEEKARSRKIDNEEKEKVDIEQREANNLVQLPLWPDASRGVPNSVLRGSLFAAIQGKDAKYCTRKKLISNERYSIVYTGKRLTQSDLDVWETILHLAKDQKLGNKIYYTENSFLKKMRRSTGGQNKQWLKGVLSKLNATAVEITFKDNKTYSFEGSLLSEVYREDETERFVLVLEPKLHRIFEEGNTWISWEDRQMIGKRKPLALWLHGYISSHARWYPHKVTTLRDYSGSETSRERRFKESLDDALSHLLKLELIQAYEIDEKNLVHVEQVESKSQQKHLSKKAE